MIVFYYVEDFINAFLGCTKNGFKTVKTGPFLQSHFTWQTHWLLSVKTDKNIPFIIDSMHSSEHGLTSATEIQLYQNKIMLSEWFRH